MNIISVDGEKVAILEHEGELYKSRREIMEHNFAKIYLGHTQKNGVKIRWEDMGIRESIGLTLKSIPSNKLS